MHFVKRAINALKDSGALFAFGYLKARDGDKKNPSGLPEEIRGGRYN